VADRHRKTTRRRSIRFAAFAATFGLVAALFSGVGGASTAARAQHKVHQAGGGDLTFGLEAENTNYCLSNAQMAISGIQVAAAIYDTLTAPNAQGKAVPYLAKSVKPNADFTVWTIGLRPGVKFHDGTPVDGAAVKLNLDSYRGAPGAPNSGVLFPPLLTFVKDVTVVDPLTVKVTMNTPVTDYPDWLYATGRFGVMAPAQLNAGGDCATKMIGSGPFMLKEYKQGDHTTVVKNPNYWQKGYPKANSITFVPVSDGPTRVNQFQGGQLDVMHTNGALEISQLKTLTGVKLMTEKPGYRETRQYVLNATKAPFDNPDARKAFMLAIDRVTLRQLMTKNAFQAANGLVDTKAPGYLKNAGYPNYNLKAAKALVAKVKAANGGKFDIILGTTDDSENKREVTEMKQELAKAGINATLSQSLQANLITDAVTGKFHVFIWRQQYGEFSDSQDYDSYPWFGSAGGKALLTNFAHIVDPAIQSALDKGRGATTPAAIKSAYKALAKALAKSLTYIPVWYPTWVIASQSNVKVTLPNLPDGGGKPLFVYGRIPVLGLSKG
jgi:peptide/nickel transport system substrate-binding protein